MPDSRNQFQGESLRLAGLLNKDAKTILNWYCDSRFMAQWDTDPLIYRTEEAVSDWIDELDGDLNRVVFGLRRTKNDALVGMIFLDDIEWSNRVADISIAIGNPKHWGRGWGSEAMRLLIDYAFSVLNLYRLQLSVMSNNTRAINLYETLGFRQEGVLREFGEKEQERYDLYLFGLLRQEWATVSH